VVNSILSWKVWIPLSRLTFCTYLVHPIVQFIYYNSIKRLLELSHETMIILHFGFFVISYLAALMTTIIFESPVIRLERLIRNKFMSKKVS
ncbi:uncharacterized protein TNCT_339311, partial [Trichonephila clavata]